MEKQGIVQAGTTPDIESKLTKRPTEKTSSASSHSQTKALDDDPTKRAADAVAKRLR